MDADLSNEPRELKILIAGIEAGYDICMGSRFLLGGGSDDMPLLRRFGNRVFVLLVNLIYGAKYTDLSPFLSQIHALLSAFSLLHFWKNFYNHNINPYI